MRIKPAAVRKIYAAVFLALMTFLGLASVFQLIYNKYPAGTGDEAVNTKKAAAIAFPEQYPFEENEENGENGESNDKLDSANEEAGSGFIGNYLNFAHEIIDKTNIYLTEHNPFAALFRKMQNALCNYYDGNIYYNGSALFVKLSNGHFAGYFDYCPSTEAWGSVLDFAAWLKNMDIPYVTLITPDKADDSITVFPQGIPHGYSQTLDEYKAFLDGNGLYYIETKQVLLSENSDFYSWFYRSDHHWNVHAAFAAARETAEILNERFSIPADTGILDHANFRLAVYPDSFLGSYGKKLGDDALKENMEVLYPVTATDFHIEIPNSGIEKTGSFDTTLIDQSLLGGTESSYSAFLHGDLPLIRIENNTCSNGSRILVIKYSFGDSYCPYLANTVQYLDVIDPRSFDGSIRSFIKQTEPDAVILCMGVVTEYDEDNLQLK